MFSQREWATESFLNTVSSKRLPATRDNCKQSKLNEEKIFRLASAIFKPGATAESLCSDRTSYEEIKDAITENCDHFSCLNLQVGYAMVAAHIREPVDYHKESVPGARLPHCWLESPSGQISSLDLVNGLEFVLISSKGFTTLRELDFNGITVSMSLLGFAHNSAVLVRLVERIARTVKTIEEAETLPISYLQFC